MSRDSVPVGNETAPLVLFNSRSEKLALEARNGLLQFDEVLRLVTHSNGVLALTPQILKNLQRIAIQDIYACAGSFREGPISISGTTHVPPHHQEVERSVKDMCDYANDTAGKTPIHTSAYLLWRLNWIHPFRGGNGRTSRAVSYLALCVRLGFVLPGQLSIPEQIVQNRQPYYDALDAADAEWKENQRLELSRMEQLLERMLARQLLDIHHAATRSV